MSIDEAIDAYPIVSEKVFSKPKSIITGDAKFSEEALVKAMKDIVGSKLRNPNAKLRDDSENPCKV
jgi:hypothetical protein